MLNLPERLCHERNAGRADRSFGPHVIRNQVQQLRRSLQVPGPRGLPPRLRSERGRTEVEAATLERQPLWNDLRHEHGPFDIIGDVHGCCGRAGRAARQAGLCRSLPDRGGPLASTVYAHPAGRKAIFVGDLVDRGPRVLDTLQHRPRHGRCRQRALCVPGNHDVKLLRQACRGTEVQSRARPGRDARRNRSAARRKHVPQSCAGARGVSRFARQPLRARRRQAGRRPCRA